MFLLVAQITGFSVALRGLYQQQVNAFVSEALHSKYESGEI
jgi:hypothetical protein